MVHFSKCSTTAANCSPETQIEMKDGTVEHFPGVGFRVLQHRSEVADHVGGLVGLDGGEGVQGLLQVAAVCVEVPQSVGQGFNIE